MSEISTKKLVWIRVTKNVRWDDDGCMRLVFRKGWEGEAIAYYDKKGNINSVSAESPFYDGVQDEVWEDCYEIVEILDEVTTYRDQLLLEGYPPSSLEKMVEGVEDKEAIYKLEFNRCKNDLDNSS